MNRRAMLLVGMGPLLAGLSSLHAQAEPGFEAEQYRLLPLRIHLLRSRSVPDLDTRLDRREAERIIAQVNRVWAQAGVRFYVEAVFSEEAARQDLYAALGENRTEEHLRMVRPKESQSAEVVHVYFVRRMRPNGVCIDLSRELIFVKDTARLNVVPGGLEEQLPRVTAHEIGHALGLLHRQNTFNLMASGTTGFSLNAEEIATARRTAEGFKFHLEPKDALVKATQLAEAGSREQAAALYTALAGLPEGEIAREARSRLEKLPRA